MHSISKFKSRLKFIFTDIDDTLTDHGLLRPEAYNALWELKKSGLKVIPVTGRPAGWCELIARQWPVTAVIGENGAFYFSYQNKKMRRSFYTSEQIRRKNQKKLAAIETEVLKKIPQAALASDQFCRLFDLAIDYCEDIHPLSIKSVQKIVSIFENHGAQAKVSSIHVNGWFGDYNKLSMVLKYLKTEWGIDSEDAKKIAGFSGDSPNDEPMFEFFPHSFGVANVKKFTKSMKHLPTYVAPSKGGKGFAEISRRLIQCRVTSSI